MEKDNLFLKMAKWSDIRFDHARLIKHASPGKNEGDNDLYICEKNENKAHLFICHVPPETDPTALMETYTGWIKEYRKK